MHYCLSERDDSDFWRQVRATPAPDTLRERIETYRSSGRVRPRAGELFSDLSWFYVLEGLGVRPRAYDPLMDVVPPRQFADMIARIARETADACRNAPTHDAQLSMALSEPRA